MPASRAFAINREEVLSQLKRQPILLPLGDTALAGLLIYAAPRTLRARGKLFSAGDVGSAVYLVLSGWIKLSRPGAFGRDMVLELAGPGSLFGELAVLFAMPRAADAVALSAARVLTIDGRALIDALRRQPDAMLAVIRLLGERLARMTALVEEGQMPAEPRLARTLLRLAALDPKPTPSGLIIDLGLSQTNLGEMTGLARESINKLLSNWKEQNLISLDGRKLILQDVAALRLVADV